MAKTDNKLITAMETNKGRGRPRGATKDHVSDPDSPGVVMIEVVLRDAESKGKQLSLRAASQWAAASVTKSNLIGKVVYHSTPIPTLSSTGHRNSPVIPALEHGYHEFEIDNSMGTFDADADRLRKKYLAWKRRPEAKKWLEQRCTEVTAYLASGALDSLTDLNSL